MKSLLDKLVIIFATGIVIFGFGNIEILRAQGAWVLWTKHTKYFSEEDIGRKEDIVGKKGTWELEKGFPSYVECIQFRESHVKEIRKFIASAETEQSKQNMMLIPTDNYSIVIMNKKPFYFYSVTYECLPDTIDPRK